LGGDDFDQLIIDDCIKMLKLGASLNARFVSSSVRLMSASDKDSNFDLLMRYAALEITTTNYKKKRF
jgi:hypothetical protein